MIYLLVNLIIMLHTLQRGRRRIYNGRIDAAATTCTIHGRGRGVDARLVRRYVWVNVIQQLEDDLLHDSLKLDGCDRCPAQANDPYPLPAPNILP